MEISVKDQRVLISAAASGIGCAVAKAFLDNGAKVHICDINDDQLSACTTSLPGAGVSRVDVSDPAQVDQLFEELISNLGGLKSGTETWLSISTASFIVPVGRSHCSKPQEAEPLSICRLQPDCWGIP